MGWEYDLRQAVIRDDLNFVLNLLNSSQDVRRELRQKQIWFRGENPVHFACRKGRIDFLSVLLDAGADVNAVSGAFNMLTFARLCAFF